jgi:hypothetical protein
MRARCNWFTTSIAAFTLLIASACTTRHEGEGASAGRPDPSETITAGAGGSSGVGGSTGGAGGAGGGGASSGGAASVDGASDAGPTNAPVSGNDAAVERDAMATSEGAGAPHESFEGCRGPADPGCEACAERDGGGFRSASDGADWFNVSSVDSSCGADCPVCASCTYRDEEDARALELRQECLPCTDDPGVDPCFGPNSCGCQCLHYNHLRERCPTLF